MWWSTAGRSIHPTTPMPMPPQVRIVGGDRHQVAQAGGYVTIAARAEVDLRRLVWLHETGFGFWGVGRIRNPGDTAPPPGRLVLVRLAGQPRAAQATRQMTTIKPAATNQ